MLKSDRNSKIFTTKTLKVGKLLSQNLTLNYVETIKLNMEHMKVGLQLRLLPHRAENDNNYQAGG